MKKSLLFKRFFLTVIIFGSLIWTSNGQTIIYSDAYDLRNGFTFEGSYTTDGITPTGLTFSPDGSKLFMVGLFDDEVFQYNLSIPFDVTSTVTLDGSRNVALGVNEKPNGFAFNGNGTELFSIDEEFDRILGFTLSTPFDITDGLSRPFGSPTELVGSFETIPEDFAFNSDGTKRYILGRSGDDITQFSNTNPYRIVGGSLDGTFSVASETGAPYGMVFSGNDQIMLVSSIPNIIQYSLSTPGEVVSGVNLDDTFFNFSTTSTPEGIAYNNDGSKFYVLTLRSDVTSGSISQYRINIANENFTESNLSDGLVEGSASIRISGETFTSAGGNLTVGTDFNITNLPAGLIPAIAISADGEVATLTFSGNAVSSQDSDDVASIEITFNNSAFTGNDANAVSNAVSASTGFGIDFTSSEVIYTSPVDVQDGVTFDQTTNISGEDAFYNLDGTKLFVLGETGDNVSQYSLSTPFTITSELTLDGMFDVGNEEITPTGFFFSTNGQKMFVVGSSGDDVNQYDLSKPYDVTETVSFEGSFSIAAQENLPQGISFSTDGSKMFITGQSSEVNQYSLTNPFDITTGVSFDGSPLNVSGVDSNPTDLVFNADGTKLFIIGFAQRDLNQYNLVNPFDITSGVTFDAGTFPSLIFDFTPLGLSLSPSGDSFLVIGSGATSQYNFDETGFAEGATNDGSVDGSIVIKLVNASFTNAGGSLMQGSDFNILNLPAGLVPNLTVAPNGIIATLTLSGAATGNNSSDDVIDLRFTFTNAAFTSNNAAAIASTTDASSNLGISFRDNPSLIYGFDPFDLSVGATLESPTFDISSQETSPTSMTFSADGTKMFVIGNSGNDINQYSLTNPFDIRTGVAFELRNPTGNNPQGITFSPDGTKMYLISTVISNLRVLQYNLPSPFDLGTDVLVAEDLFTIPFGSSGITFSNDGTKMFISNLSNDDITQYSLSTPFDISGSVVVDGSLSVPDAPTGIDFSPDGTTLFYVRANNTFPEVLSYELETPFEITSGASLNAGNINLLETGSFHRGIAVNPSGNRLFVLNSSGDDVLQYNLNTGGFQETIANDGTVEGSLTIRFSEASNSFNNPNGSLLPGSDFNITNLPAGLTPAAAVSADGSSLEITLSGTVGNTNLEDISDLVFSFENSAFSNGDVNAVNNATNASSNIGIDFLDSPEITYRSDGFNLNSTVTFDGNSVSINGDETSPSGITFNNDGSKMFIIGNTGDEVNQYTLNTNFDVLSGISLDGTPFSVASQDNSPTGIQFSNNGMKMFMIGAQTDRVYQYNLTTAFDINSTVTLDGNFSVNAQETTPQDFTFNDDGTKLFVIGSTGDDVNQYTLTAPFDITGGVSFDGSPFSLATEESVPSSIAFNNDGTRMFITGLSGDDVNQYSLSSPFDVTAGVVFQTNFSVASQENVPTGIYFNENGSRMFITGANGDDVNQYDLEVGGFVESMANDGAVTGTLSILLDGDIFTSAGTVLNPSRYQITNLPVGLIPTITVALDGSSAVLALSGNATNNQASNNVNSLEFTFENTAFVSGNATAVVNAIAASSNASIIFENNLVPAFTWIGGTSGSERDWSTADNWSDNTVPNASNSVVIPMTAHQPIISTQGLVDDLMIENGALVTVLSDATLAIAGNVTATGTGSVQINKQVDGGLALNLVGSMVTNNSIADIAPDVAFFYNEANNVFMNASGVLSPGVGVFVAYDVLNPEIVFNGIPNHGTVNAILSNQGAGENGVQDGFNIVANPFTDAIDRQAFLDLNGNDKIDGTVWIWQDGGGNLNGRRLGDYISVNRMGVVNPMANGIFDENTPISAGQGFFVLATNDAVQLTFTPVMQESLSGGAREEQPKNRDLLKISLAGNGEFNSLYNELIVGFDEQATLGEDPGLDGLKFSGSENISFYSLIDDQPYAIQALPILDDESISIPLGFYLSQPGTYTLSVKDLQIQDNGLIVYFHDAFTDEIHDLSVVNTIEFTTDEGEYKSRFSLEFVPNQVTAIDDQLANSLELMHGDQTQFSIAYPSSKEQVILYDLSGKILLKRETVFIDGRATISAQLSSSQVYVLKVNDETITFKVQ